MAIRYAQVAHPPRTAHASARGLLSPARDSEVLGLAPELWQFGKWLSPPEADMRSNPRQQRHAPNWQTTAAGQSPRQMAAKENDILCSVLTAERWARAIRRSYQQASLSHCTRNRKIVSASERINVSRCPLTTVSAPI